MMVFVKMTIFLGVWMLFLTFPHAQFILQSEEIQACTTGAKIDLQLIVDSSSSVQKRNFERMMQGIAKNLISQLDIGEDKTRVGLFVYNHEMYKEFGLDTYTDASSLKKAIGGIEFRSGLTYTATALRSALPSFIDEMREDSIRVCIVFTNGDCDKLNCNAVEEADIPAAREAWEKQNVTLFAVGFGRHGTRQGMAFISGSKKRALARIPFKLFFHTTKPAMKVLSKVCKATPGLSFLG